jgi:TPR repeat protein
MVIIRAMRHVATRSVPLLGMAILSGLHAYAQNKTACELVSKADAEAILGVTLEAPKPSAPFRSLLDPDFTSGSPEQGCEFTNFTFNYSVPNRPKPPKIVNVRLEVRYSSTPNAHAVDETRKQVDTRTYDHPTDLPGLGDAAFWIGAPNNVTLFVFIGGTTRLMIGPSEIGLEQEKALAAKALASLGKATFTYGDQPTGLNKPVLGKPGPNASGIEQLKRALTAKADKGDAKAQFALGRLYQSGTVAPDGTAQHDYAGAAYWYHQASDQGEAQATYELAIFYRDGLGVPADAPQSFQLLQKAAEANYVPAMTPLSDAYAGQKTPVSGQRATYWATKAAEAGDPQGWLILGFEYDTGKLGGDPPYWHRMAMEAYKKAANGGNCMAMMEIGDLYANGGGVPADNSQAQSWHTKAQTCVSGNLALLQQQAGQYRARAAAARDPALSAILVPKLTIASGGNGSRAMAPAAAGGRGFGFSSVDKNFITGLAAIVAIAIAIDVMYPDSSSGNTASVPSSGAPYTPYTPMTSSTSSTSSSSSQPFSSHYANGSTAIPMGNIFGPNVVSSGNRWAR